MGFKMKGWSPFEKDLFKGKTTKVEKENQDSLALEEAKKKMSKWELADYEKIQRHNYHPDGTPREVPINKKWEKQPDGEYKLVSKVRGKSTGKTSKTPAAPDWSKPSTKSHPRVYYNPSTKKRHRSKWLGYKPKSEGN